MADYTVGDVLPFAAATTDDDGNPADVGSMTLSVTLDGTPVLGSPFSVASDVSGSGLYSQDVAATGPGLYAGYWLGLGANAGAWKQRFLVSSVVDYSFVSLQAMKEFLRIPQTDTSQDRKLENYIAAATRTVESYVGPIVARTITERHQHSGGDFWVMLRRPPVLSITSVVRVDGASSLITGDLDHDEFGRGRYRISWTVLPEGYYQWTYQAGRTGEIPEDLVEAVKSLVKERWPAQRGAGGVPATGADPGVLQFHWADPLSPMVSALLRPYILPMVA